MRSILKRLSVEERVKPTKPDLETDSKECVDWLNIIFQEKSIVVSDLKEIFENGINLIYLIEILNGSSIGNFFMNPIFPFQKIDNTVKVFTFMRDEWGINMLGFEKDIIDGNINILLNLVMILKKKYERDNVNRLEAARLDDLKESLTEDFVIGDNSVDSIAGPQTEDFTLPFIEETTPQSDVKRDLPNRKARVSVNRLSRDRSKRDSETWMESFIDFSLPQDQDVILTDEDEYKKESEMWVQDISNFSIEETNPMNTMSERSKRESETWIESFFDFSIPQDQNAQKRDNLSQLNSIDFDSQEGYEDLESFMSHIFESSFGNNRIDKSSTDDDISIPSREYTEENRDSRTNKRDRDRRRSRRRSTSYDRPSRFSQALTELNSFVIGDETEIDLPSDGEMNVRIDDVQEQIDIDTTNVRFVRVRSRSTPVRRDVRKSRSYNNLETEEDTEKKRGKKARAMSVKKKRSGVSSIDKENVYRRRRTLSAKTKPTTLSSKKSTKAETMKPKKNNFVISGRKKKSKEYLQLGPVHLIYICTIQCYFRKHNAKTTVEARIGQNQRLSALRDENIFNQVVKSIVKAQSLFRTKYLLREHKKIRSWCEKYDIVKELYTTEKNYISTLQCFMDIYWTTLKTKGEDIIPSYVFKHLKNSLDVIINYNSAFRDELKTRIDNYFLEGTKIGDILLKYADTFKVYCSYINRYDQISELVNQASQNHLMIRQILDDCRNHPDSHLHNFDSLIITPIQRVTKYEIFVGSLLKHTDANDIDHFLLTNARQSFINVNTYMDIKKKEAINSDQVMQIGKMIRGFQPSEYTVAHRRYEMQGELCYSTVEAIDIDTESIEWKQGYFFCFNDVIVSTKIVKFNPKNTKKKFTNQEDQFKYVDTFRFSDVDLVEIGNDLVIGLFNCETSQITLLCTNTNEEKLQWVETIDKCIVSELKNICSHIIVEDIENYQMTKSAAMVQFSDTFSLDESPDLVNDTFEWQEKSLVIKDTYLYIQNIDHDEDIIQSCCLFEVSASFFGNFCIEIKMDDVKFYLKRKDTSEDIKLLRRVRNSQRLAIHYHTAERLNKIPRAMTVASPFTKARKIDKDIQGYVYRITDYGVDFEYVVLDNKHLSFQDNNGHQSHVVDLSQVATIVQEDIKMVRVMNRKIFFCDLKRYGMDNRSQVVFGTSKEKLNEWVTVLNKIIPR